MTCAAPAKVAHLRARAEVALHLDTAASGGDVVLLRGRAAAEGLDQQVVGR